MEEEKNTGESVETAETTEQVENTEETPKEQEEKTFSQDEVNKIVQKEKAKVKRSFENNEQEAAKENGELLQRIEELEAQTKQVIAENDSLKHEKDVSSWKANAAKEFGVDVSILRGNTEEEINAHAEAIKKSISYPNVDLSGQGKEAFVHEPTEREQTMKALKDVL